MGGPGHEKSSTRKLGVVSAVNLAGFALELAGGLMFGSVALLSDAFHMLFDALAYLIAFGSAYLAEKNEGSSYWSFGLHRLETLSAFTNGALLIPMAFYILWESYQRFLNPVEIGVLPTLAIGAGGLAVNLVSVYYLRGGEMSLNEKGAFYHLLGDAGGSLLVILSTAVIYFTGFRFFDPLAAVLIAGIIVWSAGKVLVGSTNILLHKSPVKPAEIRDALYEIDNVHGVRELRIWNLCSQITIASVHICDSSSSLEESRAAKNKVRKVLSENGVDHSTIEMESHENNACKHELDH